MESSEDDAGAATNASRRASAREKDVGGSEDGSASDGGQPAPPTGATSEAASMSEEAFDGDSVPSPSAQDVNTSTEAILDMIDEIVDGPGAPKRRTLASEDLDNDNIVCANISDQPSVEHEPIKSEADAGPSQPSVPSPAASAHSENVCREDANNALTECTIHSDATIVEVNAKPPLASSSGTEDVATESTLPEPLVEPTPLSSSVTVDETSKLIFFPQEEPIPASLSMSADVTAKAPSPVPPTTEPVLASSSVTSNEVTESILPEVHKEPSPPSSSHEAADPPTPSEPYEEPLPASSSVTVEEATKLTLPEPPEPTQATSSGTMDQAAESTLGPPDEPALACSSATGDEAAVSTLPDPSPEFEPVNVDTEASSDCPAPNIPSSSVVETVKSELDISESETCERTIKHVTSSDNRDNVTVESAESTSSDSNASERRLSVAEGSTWSPLRRRLVRPTPSDRRPDSTVSSTVDSLTVNVHTTEQPAGECVTKDVSSSSDAVPAVYGNVNPEEIRNVSEISVCKAETSMSPPKKIKLIRQKVMAPAVLKDITSEKPILTERGQCQSTSSDSHLSHATPVLHEPNSSSNSSKTLSEDVRSELSTEVVVEEVSAKSSEPVEESAKDILIEIKGTLQVSNCLPEVTPLESEKEHDDQKRVPPIKLNLSVSHSAETSKSETKSNLEDTSSTEIHQEDTPDPAKQVPKLTIKFGSKQPEEMKSPKPKFMIKPIRLPTDEEDKRSTSGQIPSVTKINIKPIIKPPEKINDVHRKSSSSEISESESSENDESNSTSDQTSTSDQASASDQGSDVVPKVTIKLGKPGTESEGKFYTEKKVSKQTKGMHHSEKEEQDSGSKLKLVISQSQEKKSEKIPKLTIKTVTKSEGEPLSPKLTIKPLKPPHEISKETDQADSQQVPKLKISADSLSSLAEVKENTHVPKITIKPVVKSDFETPAKTPKKCAVVCDTSEHIPVVTKLNIKPIVKPTECSENTHDLEEKVPMVSKLNIKPIVKPTDSGETMEVEDKVPVISKLNIKPILKPVECDNITENLEEKVPVVSKLTIKPIFKSADTSATSSGLEDNIPVVSKLNIKPVVKPTVSAGTPEDVEKVVVVSKLNIKPILKPVDTEKTPEGIEDKVPVVSKLNIKPIIKPKDIEVGSSIEDVHKVTKLNIKPLKTPDLLSSEGKDCVESSADIEENSIPVVTKLNIKPIVKPIHKGTLKDSENQSSETGNSSDDNADHIPVVTKLNIKPIVKPNDSEILTRSNTSNDENVPVVTKLNIKPLVKPDDNKSPGSPKKDNSKYTDAKSPSITKLNIKPVIRTDEPEPQKPKNEDEEISSKNPPLVMKINMSLHSTDKKINNIDDNTEHYNNVCENIPIVSKINIKPIIKPSDESKERISVDTTKHVTNCKPSSSQSHLKEMLKPNCVLDLNESKYENCATVPKGPIGFNEEKANAISIPSKSNDSSPKKPLHSKSELVPSTEVKETSRSMRHVNTNAKPMNLSVQSTVTRASEKKSTLQNCTLLKKLLETKKDGLDKRLEDNAVNANHSPLTKSESSAAVCKEIVNCESHDTELVNSESSHDKNRNNEPDQVIINDIGPPTSKKLPSNVDLITESNDSLTKPLEINVSDKCTNQSSGQDSPRIILKINKTDHGPSAKIITEEMRRPDSPSQNDPSENTHEIANDKQNQKKNPVNSRKKPVVDITSNMPMAKRLRSSKVTENVEKSPVIKRNVGKRPSTSESSPPQTKEPELSVLETKRMKLGQLLSNKSLTVTPITAKPQISPTKTNLEAKRISPTKTNLEIKQVGKSHSLLNNENCSKNGNSKLHNILSNLQAKQAQAIAFNDLKCAEKKPLTPELECSTSTGSSDVVEITPIENSHPEVQEMIINESSESHDFNIPSEDISQDPLEVDTSKVNLDSTSMNESPKSPNIPKPVEMTPQPKKRGRPRKLPVSEGAKPAEPIPLPLPVPALEERPQRSLRLSRERPTILVKPRGGRGRGRGAKRSVPSPAPQPEPEPIVEPIVETATKFFAEEQKPTEEIDPTSSRIKLPRMTEALDKMPSVCTTPLSSRRRESSTSDLKVFADTPELKVVLENTKLEDVFVKSPETPSRGGRGRGSRGGRGRAPGRSPRAGRGRGRGGGRGAMYMKETMGIYGRVCGPATTTVQLFEEETCMMDDNATPAKPSHLLDEDSQSSVRSSTNESSKMKKSKFADLFDSNKVWTAADVKEYKWPPPDRPDEQPQVMMIQEQVAMFLGVKSFKRRYPELKRRSIGGEERDYVLSKALVTEALCDLGITAVDASEVLDIMLSDYPHKYEEYRSHQRQKQLAEASSEETTQETKPDQKMDRVEMKVEMKPVETKPEPSKLELEKSRQDMAAAAIASASEYNARMNAMRRPSCVDLQTMTIHRRRPPPTAAPTHVTPPAGFYPHALLPGQYQHCYRIYTPEQLRYFPLNTAVAAPPAPPSPAPSSDDSEPEWGSSSSSDHSTSDRLPAKRKKLTKRKRSSQTEAVKEEPQQEVELCRACKLRLEANRKYTHERFLVCAHCNAKLHPGCVELSADTIRKCREYAWQCAECKTCCVCRLPADDDKMLFCDLCDRGHHIYCVGLPKVPSGRWHCVECAICKSCGARDPGGPSTSSTPGGPPATPGGSISTPGGSISTPSGSISTPGGSEWHHQTKRGPGGHKVYSHSLCTPCARAYRIGRYCPLCDRSFIGPKGTMQLVICKLCDRQHHQDCVRQTVSNLNVLDYTCTECRRGGITSRAAAVRLAPRTIATLFMAKRRFNKYAHRQYMQSRLQGAGAGATPAPKDNSDEQEATESCERDLDRPDEASDGSEGDPLEGVGASDGDGSVPTDEAAAAVAALRMHFGD